MASFSLTGDVWVGEKDTQRVPVPFADGFETRLANWVVSGHDWDATESAARGSAHSLTDSPAGNYAANMATYATLVHPLDLSGALSPVLEFWHKGRAFNGDQADVELPTDGGTNWAAMRYFVGPYSPWLQNGWTREEVALPSTDNVVIRFALAGNPDGAVEDGW